MKKISAVSLFLTLTAGLSACGTALGPQPAQAAAPEETWIKGMDVSEARDAELHGVQFKDRDGTVKPALQIVQNHQYNWVRAR